MNIDIAKFIGSLDQTNEEKQSLAIDLLLQVKKDLEEIKKDFSEKEKINEKQTTEVENVDE